MIRPCPTCDGSGNDPAHESHKLPCPPCPTCADMPELRCRHQWRGELMDDEARNCQRCKGRRAYKPDPEVFLAYYIRWCQTHQHRLRDRISSLCQPVWVAVPEPLEEA